jgi:ABC-type lipoprotein release transport system permease subunit
LGVFFALLTAGSGFDFAELGGTESFEVGFQGVQVASRVYPNLHGRDVIAGVVAVLVTALSACVWPMVHISKLEPVEAMRG